jgi:peptidyl-prolyl cis-trans isomerase D
MLQHIRDRVASLLAYCIIGILILAFALWGTTGLFNSGSGKLVAAEVGDSEITMKELQRDYQRELDGLRRRGVSNEQARMLGVLDNIVNRAVADKVYDQAVNKLGLSAGDDQIVADIRRNFGQIGTVQFDELMRQTGYSRNEYADMLRTRIPRLQLFQSLAAGVQEPANLVNNLYRWRAEERSAKVFEVTAEGEKVPQPSEADLKKYHEEHKAEFTAPEYRSVTFVHIAPKQVAKDIKIDEKALKKTYENRLSEFVEAERRTILQILVNTDEDAKKAYDKLQAGADFAAVAKEIAKQEEDTTKIGTVTRADLPEAIAKEAFALEAGKYSKPFGDAFGKRIVKVTEIKPQTTKPFDAVKESLAKEMRTEQATEAVVALANQLEDALGKGSSLEVAAEKLALPLHKVAAMNLGGADKNDKPIEDLPAKPFNATVFNGEVGQVSFLTETRNDGFFVARVDSVEKSALRPLDTVKDAVTAAWLKRKRRSVARDKAEKLAKQINDGSTIESLAEAAGAKISTVGPVRRDQTPANAPAILSKIFAVKAKGKATFSPSSKGYLVAVLSEIKAPEGKNVDKETAPIKNNIKIGMISDLLEQYQRALRKRYETSVDRKAIQKFFDQQDTGGGGR